MGTKVHCNSYLLGYYPMRDLNEDASSTWPLHFEDRRLNGQFCNVFTSRPVNGYSEYDMLKQTMLKHEEIFRKQVLELHRLYRIQRDMMVELKRKREQRFSVQVNSSKPRPVSTHILPRDKENTLREHVFPFKNASCSLVTVSCVDDAHTHLSLLNGSSFHSGPMSRDNGDSQEVSQFLDFKSRKLPRLMLDLQLPADAYMENDDAVCAEEKDVFKPLIGSADLSNRNCGHQSNNDFNLTLVTAQNANDEIKKSCSHLSNGLCPQKLADLNEPLSEVSCEEVAVSSSRFSVEMAKHEGLEGHEISRESVSSFLGLQKDLLHDRYTGGTGSLFLCIDRGEREPKQLFFNNEIGQSSNHVSSFTSSLNKKDVQRSSEPVLVKPRKTHDFSTIFSPKQSKTESWFREHSSQPSQINKLSDIMSSYNLDTKYSGLTIPTVSSPLSSLPCTDYAKTSSPLISSWGKSSNSISPLPIELQALSGVSGSTPMTVQSRSAGTCIQNHSNAWDKRQCSHDLRSTSSFGCETCLYPNCLHHGFPKESSASSHVILPTISFDKPNFINGAHFSYEKSEVRGLKESFKGLHDAKSVKEMNLNAEPPNGFRNAFVSQQKLLSDVEGKKESLSGGVSWLRTRSTCSEPINIHKGTPNKEFGTMQEYSQMMPNYCTSIPQVDQEKDTEDSPIERILGFPMPQCSKIIFTPNLHQEISQSDVFKKRVKEEVIQADSPYHGKLLDLDKQTQAELILEKGSAQSVNGFRDDDINLNSSAANIDQPNSATSSSKDEMELLSPVSVQGTATRFVSEIDLEAPITSLLDEEMQLAESASHCNRVFSVVEPDSKREGVQAADIGDETLVKMAAETIHMMSLDKPLSSENITLSPSPPASAEILHWFADVVTFNADGPENVLGTLKGDGHDDRESSDIDGMDYFEYMTLQLKETKIDNQCCRHLERENPTEEETGVTHLLLTRSRRGQARRRRQRRDFQKDILPGLSSLSRYEVTEDLQVIEGLMRASGQLWQPGGVRRATGRTRSHSQVKGTRPRGNAAVAVVVDEIQVDPQPRQPSTDVEIDARSIVGWGRTTRRCRRQRCSSGNVLIPPQS